MAVERDFRVLGQEPRSLPRKALGWLGTALKWAFLASLIAYLAIQMFTHHWTDLQTHIGLLVLLGWIGLNHITDKLTGLNYRLDEIERRIDRLTPPRD